MKKGISLVFALLFTSSIFAAATPAGNWTTIDDSTGLKRAVVRLSVSNGSLNGSLVKVYPQPGDSGVCSKCPGNLRDKPVQGLQFIWGLKDMGNGVWEGGQILDPRNGKIYKAKMTLDGDKLYVRGYIGITAIGRTQTWVR
ncbi:MAG: DUF2147 domain-containing protein [Tatlockia sp.]|nr:DUF2147 domain-containing protein [Tatlockia sp.]